MGLYGQYGVVVRAFSVGAALSFAACAGPSAVKTVDFENPAYAIGDAYNKAAQSADWDVTHSGTRMDSDHAIISEDYAASGARSLRIIYPKNQQSVKQASWHIPGKPAYTLRYKVRFADDFEFNGQAGASSGKNGGKLPGLAARPVDDKGICTGGQSCDFGRGFSARLMWRTDGAGLLYLYDLTKSRTGETWGENFEFAGGAKFTPGVWHSIRQDIILNTPGQANGSVTVWLDGRRVVRVDGREIIGGDEHIDTVLFSTFFGGNMPHWYPAVDQTAYFDDFVISDCKSD